nr:hypothetical protein HUO10_002367 [Paraburkholderia busanensis]
MSSRVLCPRHGFQGYARSSNALRDGIRARGQFEPGQLVKLSVDRRKRSYEMWMARSDVAEYEHYFTYENGVAHLTHFPSMAAIERTIVYVCPRCRDELLVRSGEPPMHPTSHENAFGHTPVAADIVMPQNTRVCATHGLYRPTATSHWIADKLRSGRPLTGRQLIRTIVVRETFETQSWFDDVYLRRRFGTEIDLTSSVFRIRDEHSAILFARSPGVCGDCLHARLAGAGIDI